MALNTVWVLQQPQGWQFKFRYRTVVKVQLWLCLGPCAGRLRDRFAHRGLDHLFGFKTGAGDGRLWLVLGIIDIGFPASVPIRFSVEICFRCSKGILRHRIGTIRGELWFVTAGQWGFRRHDQGIRPAAASLGQGQHFGGVWRAP